MVHIEKFNLEEKYKKVIKENASFKDVKIILKQIKTIKALIMFATQEYLDQ